MAYACCFAGVRCKFWDVLWSNKPKSDGWLSKKPIHWQYHSWQMSNSNVWAACIQGVPCCHTDCNWRVSCADAIIQLPAEACLVSTSGWCSYLRLWKGKQLTQSTIHITRGTVLCRLAPVTHRHGKQKLTAAEISETDLKMCGTENMIKCANRASDLKWD